MKKNLWKVIGAVAIVLSVTALVMMFAGLGTTMSRLVLTVIAALTIIATVMMVPKQETPVAPTATPAPAPEPVAPAEPAATATPAEPATPVAPAERATLDIAEVTQADLSRFINETYKAIAIAKVSSNQGARAKELLKQKEEEVEKFATFLNTLGQQNP